MKEKVTKEIPTEPQLNEPLLPPVEPAPAESRLKEHEKKQTMRNVWMVVGGIILIGAIFLLFGTQLLIGFSLLLGGDNQTNNETIAKNDETVYIAPPILDDTEEATKSATIIVSGETTTGGQMVNLYVNGKLSDKIKSKSNKTFKIRNVKLKEGENEIKAKIVSENNQLSSYSNTISVTYVTKAPELSIDYPQDGQSVKKDQSPIEIRGKTNPGVKVTVNDFWAIVENDGSYSYNYRINDGDNKVKVVATDDAGNKTEKEITFKSE